MRLFKERFHYTLSLVFISLLVFLMTMFGELGELSLFEFTFIALYVLFFLAAQSLIINDVCYFFRHNAVAIALFAAAVAFNVLCLDFFFREYIFGDFLFRIKYKALASLLFFFIFCGFFANFSHPGFRKFATLATFLLLTATVTVFGIQNLGRTEDIPARAGISQLDYIRTVSFDEKPNVYFIGFDASVPPKIGKDLLGLQSLNYWRVLRQKKAQIFNNSFADRVSTKNAWNSLLAFDPNYFDQADSAKYGFFDGKSVSPLLAIFRSNGYQAKAIMDLGYLGPYKGPYIDAYALQNRHNNNLAFCQFLGSYQKLFSFFGVCLAVEITPLDRLLNSETAHNSGNYVGFILNEFQKTLASGKPAFQYLHLYSPGHTPYDGSYDYHDESSVDRFRQWYTKKSNIAGKQMRRILDFLEENDPSALIYIFGDHGTYMSRGLSIGENKRFYFQDRYGALSAFLPADKCRSSFASPPRKEFVTHAMVARMIVRCLAGGEDPFTKDIDYKIVYRDGDTLVSERYEDFVYE